MRRLPPQKVEHNLAGLLDIAPEMTEELLSSIDQPLKVKKCKKTGRDFLICDYNRDGDSYRSPWSNEYDPPLEDGAMPSDNIRELEIAANEAFDTYREMYFEGGTSSVYMWELETGFAAVILVKKVSDSSNRMKGAWDSIHVLEIQESKKSAHYKLTSTVMLYMLTSKPQTGEVNLSGSMTRQVEQNLPLEAGASSSSSHICNIGQMVEDMEIKMRQTLQEIYFGKTRDIVNDLHSVQSLEEKSKQEHMQRELAATLTRKD